MKCKKKKNVIWIVSIWNGSTTFLNRKYFCVFTIKKLHRNARYKINPIEKFNAKNGWQKLWALMSVSIGMNNIYFMLHINKIWYVWANVIPTSISGVNFKTNIDKDHCIKRFPTKISWVKISKAEQQYVVYYVM